MPSWADLNERQQKYLQAIYDQDQENERHEKSQWTRGGRPRLATEWRWMFYGIEPLTGSDSPLRHRLKVVGLVDPGTGATFEALEKRGYILCRYTPVVAGDVITDILALADELKEGTIEKQLAKSDEQVGLEFLLGRPLRPDE